MGDKSHSIMQQPLVHGQLASAMPPQSQPQNQSHSQLQTQNTLQAISQPQNQSTGQPQTQHLQQIHIISSNQVQLQTQIQEQVQDQLQDQISTSAQLQIEALPEKQQDCSLRLHSEPQQDLQLDAQSESHVQPQIQEFTQLQADHKIEVHGEPQSSPPQRQVQPLTHSQPQVPGQTQMQTQALSHLISEEQNNLQSKSDSPIQMSLITPQTQTQGHSQSQMLVQPQHLALLQDLTQQMDPRDQDSFRDSAQELELKGQSQESQVHRQAMSHISQGESQSQALSRSDPLLVQTFDQLHDTSRLHAQTVCHDQPQSEHQGHSYQNPKLDSENHQQQNCVPQTVNSSEPSQELSHTHQDEIQHSEQTRVIYGSVSAPQTSSSRTTHGTQVYHQVSCPLFQDMLCILSKLAFGNICISQTSQILPVGAVGSMNGMSGGYVGTFTPVYHQSGGAYAPAPQQQLYVATSLHQTSAPVILAPSAQSGQVTLSFSNIIQAKNVQVCITYVFLSVSECASGNGWYSYCTIPFTNHVSSAYS